eukprot:4460677-Pyramimonas_sp.AAC.1
MAGGRNRGFADEQRSARLAKRKLKEEAAAQQGAADTQKPDTQTVEPAKKKPKNKHEKENKKVCLPDISTRCCFPAFARRHGKQAMFEFGLLVKSAGGRQFNTSRRSIEVVSLLSASGLSL